MRTPPATLIPFLKAGLLVYMLNRTVRLLRYLLLHHLLPANLLHSGQKVLAAVCTQAAFRVEPCMFRRSF